MAKLWKLPVLFICENNHYGMGTSDSRASASISFYTRGDYVPGIHVDGMDVYAAKNAIQWAKEYALKNGPLVIEMETYRYVGHSMVGFLSFPCLLRVWFAHLLYGQSDPGISYRSKEEVNKVRESRDPIIRQRARMLEHGIKEEQVEELDASIKEQVDQAVKFATAAPFPQVSELFTDVLTTPVEVRGRTLDETFKPSSTRQ